MPINLSGVTVSNGMFMGEYTNVIPASLDIYSWAYPGGAFNATISRDTSTGLSPAGGVPLKMAVTANDPYLGSYNSAYFNLASAAIGQTWRATVYVKASSACQAGIFIFGATDAGVYIEAPASVNDISTSWTKISFTYTFLNASTTKIQTRLDGPDTGGTGINLWWDQYLLYRIS